MAGVPSGTSVVNNGEIMKKLLVILFLLPISFVYCNLVTVAEDSTGDFSAIQAAIIASANYDSILVYPGIYYENIDYMGKTIVIGSLYMITGEDEYIHSTIIDGNENGSVVTLENNEGEGTTINGFVIRNGNSINGGGIYIDDAFINIIKCVVKNNFALSFTGGVACKNESNVFLSGTTIKDNYCQNRYGGLTINHETQVTFDQVNLCSIYGNYAPDHCDIHICVDQEDPIYHEVYLDTFSCLEPDRYFIGAGDDGFNYNWEYLDLHVNTEYYDFYDGDLYVSPEGDDRNSGTNPEEPMKTIAWAITKIVSNPEDPNTVHLLNGTYSTSMNDQLYPLNMKAYVSLVGDSMDDVILNGEDKAIVLDYYSGFEYELSNMTFISEPVYFERICRITQQYIDPMQVRMQNLKITDSSKIVFWISSSIEFTMNNIIVKEGTNHFLTYNSAPGNHSIVENCQVINSESALLHQNYDHNGERARLDVFNTLVADNLNSFDYRDIWSYIIDTAGYAETNLINCTIMNNECDNQSYLLSCVCAHLGGNFNIYNSCIYSNDGYEVSADTGDGGILGSTITVSHSLIEGGESGIHLVGDYPSTLNWLDGNLDCDPLVDEDYHPLDNSPLIDAGSLHLPEGIVMPEYDLAGNPRIMGNEIDIGAYEYNPYSHPVSVDDEMGIADFEYYPNPVRLHEGRGAVMINYAGRLEDNDYRIGIYNVKGQKVWESELWRGLEGIRWNCCDANGVKVAVGVYFLRLSRDGEYLSQGKLTVIK